MTLSNPTDENIQKPNPNQKMKTLIIPLIYFFFVACGVHTLTSSLNEMTERDCRNSNNPYSSACVYLSTRGK